MLRSVSSRPAEDGKGPSVFKWLHSVVFCSRIMIASLALVACGDDTPSFPTITDDGNDETGEPLNPNDQECVEHDSLEPIWHPPCLMFCVLTEDGYRFSHYFCPSDLDSGISTSDSESSSSDSSQGTDSTNESTGETGDFMETSDSGSSTSGNGPSDPDSGSGGNTGM